MTNPTHNPLPAGDPQWVTQAVNAIEAFGPWPKSDPATVRALLSMWGNRIMLTSAQADTVVAEVTGLPVTDEPTVELGRIPPRHPEDGPCSQCGAPAGWAGRIDPEPRPRHPEGGAR